MKRKQEVSMTLIEVHKICHKAWQLENQLELTKANLLGLDYAETQGQYRGIESIEAAHTFVKSKMERIQLLRSQIHQIKTELIDGPKVSQIKEWSLQINDWSNELSVEI